MSTLSLYDVAIGLSQNALQTLLHILKKAQRHPDAASFPETRLREDMRPLIFQVQVVTYIAMNAVERLANRDGKAPVAVFAGDEKTMDELIARVEKALALLATAEPKDLEGAEDKTQEVHYGTEWTAPASTKQYVLGFEIPNLFFHLNMAYAILRMKGVDLGKGDYLHPFIKEICPKDWYASAGF
ncbi:hypothetical protein VTK56DRAFT_3573 [Thermocarpiscus australiensis]